jgi:hypothetical protein
MIERARVAPSDYVRAGSRRGISERWLSPLDTPRRLRPHA